MFYSLYHLYLCYFMLLKNERWKKKLSALKLAISWTYNSSKFLAITVVVVSIFGGLITIIEPYIFKIIVDKIVSSKGFSQEIKIGIGIVSILIIYGIARILQGLFWDINNLIRRVHTLRMESYSMHELMRHISSLDLIYFEDADYYNTLSRATNNFWRITEFFWQFTFLITEFISVLVIIVALVAFDWKLVILILLGAIPSVFVALKWSEMLWSAFAESSPIFRHASYYRSLLTEQPEAIKEIKSFGLKDYFLNRFRNLFTRFIKNKIKLLLNSFIGMQL